MIAFNLIEFIYWKSYERSTVVTSYIPMLMWNMSWGTSMVQFLWFCILQFCWGRKGQKKTWKLCILVLRLFNNFLHNFSILELVFLYLYFNTEQILRNLKICFVFNVVLKQTLGHLKNTSYFVNHLKTWLISVSCMCYFCYLYVEIC